MASNLEYNKEDKEASPYDFYIRRNIGDEFQKIESNPALKSLYKLFLNSTYGKTG
jgi:hypothetical protein